MKNTNHLLKLSGLAFTLLLPTFTVLAQQEHYESPSKTLKIIAVGKGEVTGFRAWRTARENGKVGFIDEKGSWIIPPQFDDADTFNKQGFAVIKQKGLAGIINTKGEIIIKPEYNYFSGNFNQYDLIKAVRYESNWLGTKRINKEGYINKQGGVIVPLVYRWAKAFDNNGFAVVVTQDDQQGLINTKGELIIPIKKYDSIEPFYNTTYQVIRKGRKYQYGLVDDKGREIIEPKYEALSLLSDNGLIAVRNTKHLTGLMDATGKWIIKPQYESIDKFTEDGIAHIKKDGKFGAINSLGVEIIPPQYDGIRNSDGGLIRVTQNHLVGLLDLTGKEVVPIEFEYITDFGDNNSTMIRKKYRQEGLVNTKGEIILPLEYDIDDFDDNGLAAIKKDNKSGFVNTQGKIVIPLQYDEVFRFFDKAFTRVKQNDKWGVIDETGKIIIPIKYEEISQFNSDGVAAIKLNHKYGFISTNNEVLVEPQYDTAFSYENNLLKVSKNQKDGIINSKGEIIIPFDYELISSMGDNGLIAVKNNNKYGFINLNNELVIDFQYDDFITFARGGWAGGYPVVKKDGKTFYIDKKNHYLGTAEEYDYD